MCVVCRRREPASGAVCDPDRDSIARQLTDLPRKMAALELQLVPGGAGPGERVSTSRGGSPPPARLDALSLAGPGNVAVSGMLHPLVRRWATTRQVVVGQTLTAGQEHVAVRTITEWHQELARDPAGQPVMVATDDQIGALPPAEWLDSWVRSWRQHFGHHDRPPAPADTRSTGRGRDAAARAVLAARTLGLDTHSRRDALVDEWETRFGEATPATRPTHDVAYLLTWLDAACDDDVGVGELAAELRALTAELTRVLGEQPDQQWLGRCPAAVTDAAATATRPCGAGLWQEPFASQVMCPRCHCTWGPKKTEILMLAKEIRRVWPVDRRRRYDADDVDVADNHRLLCPACGRHAVVSWREVTGRGDLRRFWRPDRVECPHGCPEAGRLI